ncbi:MAG: glycosyl transferase [Bacteroidales bacterium]|nr:glycosyl transferase [Bacteroidales bacterium]
MKHAYLIMAHNQFLALKELVSMLDDARNDIYIHFDRKVSTLPAISTCHSRLVILDKRVNVIWGDISQIKAEYALFNAAFKEGEYSYYHLISGVHFPLKSNDGLHRWFEGCNGACVLRKVPLSEEEIRMRFGLYHFFLKHLVSRNRFLNKTYHLGWRAMLRIQKVLGISRDTSFICDKASQWCSLNEDAVRLILSREKEAMKLFRRTFCCDEFFVSAMIGKSEIPVIYDDRICHVEFVNTTPKLFTEEDYPALKASGALFFRKLSDATLGLAKMIEEHIES